VTLFLLASVAYLAALTPWSSSSLYTRYAGDGFDSHLVLVILLVSPVFAYGFARFSNGFTDELNYYYAAFCKGDVP